MVMPSYNSIRTIKACLRSLKDQDYGGELEIVVADGGSTDGTVDILNKYDCKVVKEKTGNPETAKAIALKQATGDLVLLIATDNVLPTKDWLSKMVKVLESEPKLVAVYPWRYEVRKSDTSLNRYYALLGANDPVARFMGRADRQMWGSRNWWLAGEAQDKEDFWQVRFDKDNMPTLGDNGVLVWRDKLMKAKVDEKHFSHIDVFYDLVSLGEIWFGVVKNTIIHDTGESYSRALKKRSRYMKELYLKQIHIRRYKWVRGGKDKLKLGLYVAYSLTLVGPLMESLWGFVARRDLAWFWHPVMCVSMLFIYSKAVINSRYRTWTNYRV